MIWEDRPLIGMEFPSAADRARIATIQDNRRLWQSDHQPIFTRVSAGMTAEHAEALRRRWAALKFVNVNLLGYLSRQNAETMALDPSSITCELEATQALIDDLRDSCGWDALLIDIVEMASALGEVGLKAYRRDEVDIVIDLVEPDALFRGEDYFSEYAEMNADPRRTIAPFAVSLHKGDAEDWYVLFEMHEPGAVVWRAYRWDSEATRDVVPTLAIKGKLGQEVDPARFLVGLEGAGETRVLETGIDDPTLIVLQNEPNQFDRRHGRSDYTQDLRDLQGEFEDKLSTLLRHYREMVNGGTVTLPYECQSQVLMRGQQAKEGTASDFGRGGGTNKRQATIDPDELNVIFVDAQSKDAVSYVSRPAQYEGGLQSLQLIMSSFERVAGITLGKLLESDSAPESGRALRLQHMRDIGRVKRKGMRYRRTLAAIFEVALALRGVPNVRVAYVFPEPFPEPLTEMVDAVVAATGKPCMSTETALVDMLSFTPDEAAEEATKLEGERHADGMRSRIAGVFGQGGVSTGQVVTRDEETTQEVPPGGEA